jgi:hypothetical protein
MFQYPGPLPVRLETLAEQIREKCGDPAEYDFWLAPGDPYILGSVKETQIRTHWAIASGYPVAVKRSRTTLIGYQIPEKP